IAGEFFRRPDQGVPGPVKANIAGVEQHKTEFAANLPDHFGVEYRLRSSGQNLRAVATDLDLFRAYAFGTDAAAHVLAQHDHTRCALHCPAMKLFPNAREPSWRDDRSAHRHVRVHVADVVEIRLALQSG